VAAAGTRVSDRGEVAEQVQSFAWLRGIGVGQPSAGGRDRG
jgi:hypothetical protein